jgi:AcrR family transcriptional regulator
LWPTSRTKATILKAAQHLFADQGYERATVRDIAARAAIDPAMVIRYFGSKDQWAPLGDRWWTLRWRPD